MHFKKKIFIVGFILSAILFFQACDKTWDDHYSARDETTDKDKIISELEQVPQISLFTEAVKNIDTLEFLLDQNRLYTVFAPVNETFENIDPEILNNETLLTRLIMYHFIDGKYKYKDFSYELITAFNKKNLSISIDGSNNVLLDSNSIIIDQDNLSQNGIIQVIDKPLIPVNNLYEYLNYNSHSSQLGMAIPHYTVKEFNQNASTAKDKNDDNQLIYDSVFNYTNPFLYKLDDDRTIDPGQEFFVGDYFYGSLVRYVNIENENKEFSFVFPVNYEAALSTVKSSNFLNSPIADHHWAAPILANNIINELYSKEDIIAEVDEVNADSHSDSLIMWAYFSELLKNNYSETSLLSNGNVHLVDGFEYNIDWLITNQGNLDEDEKESTYRTDLMATITSSDNVDSVFVQLNNIKTIFYDDDITTGYTAKFGEWINIELEGEFYPVDYKVFVRGKNFASGVFQVEADGKDIGEYNFATAPSGDQDKVFDEIGVVSFTETKTSTNLKFTFVNTHPGTSTDTGEQYLWIREIKFHPIIK